MELWCESYIGRDGTSYFDIKDKEPLLNEHDFWHGGHFYSFHLDHVKNKTELYEYRYINGVPTGFDRCLKKWKDEILTIPEAIAYLKGGRANE